MPPNWNAISESNVQGTGSEQINWCFGKRKNQVLRTAVVSRSNEIRARDLIVQGLHSLVVSEDHGSPTVNDRIDGSGNFLPVEI